MTGSQPPVLVESTRRLNDGGAAVESRHRGHLVVVTPGGDRLGLGDPDHPTFYRSAVKPFQATASLELAGWPQLSDAEVAVGWASHRAEPAQLAAVGAILARLDLSPSQLTTPAVASEDDPRAPPSPIASNCSGKHALFALAGAAVACPRDRLLDPDGPVQQHVLATVAAAVGQGPPSPVSIDGCGAPAVLGPLAGLAAGFQRLVSGEGRWQRVVAAGQAAPDIVGGRGRLDSALLRAGLVAKSGAEGVFAVGFADRRGPFGVAVKVEDGAGRAAGAAVHALLVAAGIVARGAWSPPPVLGGGRPVGAVRATREVQALGEGLSVRTSHQES